MAAHDQVILARMIRLKGMHIPTVILEGDMSAKAAEGLVGDPIAAPERLAAVPVSD